MAKQTTKNLPKKQVVQLDNYSEINDAFQIELDALIEKYLKKVK